MRYWLLAIYLMLTGCSTTVNFSTPQHLASDQPRIIVMIDPNLLNKVEQSSVVWESGNYEIGAALTQLIDNKASALTKIEYVSSDLGIHQGVSIFLSGMMIADYRLTVKRTAQGQSSLVEGRGNGVSYLNSFNAGQEAIEKAVIDLVSKLRAMN